MKLTVLAAAVAALTLAAVSVSQAAPIAPPATGIARGNLTQVQYRWHGRNWGHCGWWHHHHWHCW